MREESVAMATHSLRFIFPVQIWKLTAKLWKWQTDTDMNTEKTSSSLVLISPLRRSKERKRWKGWKGISRIQILGLVVKRKRGFLIAHGENGPRGDLKKKKKRKKNLICSVIFIAIVITGVNRTRPESLMPILFENRIRQSRWVERWGV